MNNKYNKVLTILLIVLIVAIVGILIFLGAKYYKDYSKAKETKGVVQQFEDQFNNIGDNQDNNIEDVTPNININELISQGTGNGESSEKVTFKGYEVVGKIRIPATGLETIVLEKVTPSSIESSVAILYGPGLNQIGNTVIVGHNYRNGMFFSNNKKLKNGDKIYITDNSGKKLTYTIYDKFETTESDTDFYQRDTGGKPEVSLSTCTDNSKARLIILARAE